MLILSCHNMEIKTAIGNRGFAMYKKYRCLYKHISVSIRNIFASWKKALSHVWVCRPKYWPKELLAFKGPGSFFILS